MFLLVFSQTRNSGSLKPAMIGSADINSQRCNDIDCLNTTISSTSPEILCSAQTYIMLRYALAYRVADNDILSTREERDLGTIKLFSSHISRSQQVSSRISAPTVSPSRTSILSYPCLISDSGFFSGDSRQEGVRMWAEFLENFPI